MKSLWMRTTTRPKTGMTRMRKRLKTRTEMEIGAGTRRRARGKV